MHLKNTAMYFYFWILIFIFIVKKNAIAIIKIYFKSQFSVYFGCLPENIKRRSEFNKKICELQYSSLCYNTIPSFYTLENGALNW